MAHIDEYEERCASVPSSKGSELASAKWNRTRRSWDGLDPAEIARSRYQAQHS
jgi:hypothetical protein